MTIYLIGPSLFIFPESKICNVVCYMRKCAGPWEVPTEIFSESIMMPATDAHPSPHPRPKCGDRYI